MFEPKANKLLRLNLTKQLFVV